MHCSFQLQREFNIVHDIEIQQVVVTSNEAEGISVASFLDDVDFKIDF